MSRIGMRFIVLCKGYTTTRIHGSNNDIYITGITIIVYYYYYFYTYLCLQKTQEVMITDGFKNLHEENADVFTTIIHRIALTLP